MPPFKFTDISKINKGDLIKQSQGSVRNRVEQREAPLPGAWGELSLVKGNLVGVRGLIGFNTAEKELNKSGSPYAAAVLGIDDWGETGVLGTSDSGRGVAGFSNSWQGVYGHSVGQAGVVGESDNFDGVFGIAHKKDRAGISGHNPGGLAGYFDGNVTITGNVNVNGDVVLANADCAEEFETLAGVEIQPGDVMIIGENGRLELSKRAYDRRVAGIVAGAGNLRPAIRLDSARQDSKTCVAVSLIGKAYCKVDAEFGSIEIGDLLTTSETAGHAMRARDKDRAFGCVLGKALDRLSSGRGLVRVLIALQ